MRYCPGYSVQIRVVPVQLVALERRSGGFNCAAAVAISLPAAAAAAVN